MSDLRDEIRAICQECGSLAELGDDDDLVKRGCDSLVAAEILSRIERDYDVDATVEYFEEPTVNNLVSVVDRALQGSLR